MSITSGSSNLREFYFKLMAILTALYPNTTNASDKTKLVTQSFRQKLPSNIRNSTIFTTSELEGLELVKLAQRLMDANKSSNTSSNKMHTSGRGGYRGRGRGGYRGNGRDSNSYRGSNRGGSRGRGGYRGRGRGRNTDNTYNRQPNDKCNFCGLPGHWQKDCRAYEKAKQARREELSKKKSQ